MYNDFYYESEKNNAKNEHLGMVKYTGKELISQGYNIGMSTFAKDWNYIVENLIINPYNARFQNQIKDVYFEIMLREGTVIENYIPTISDISDEIDEINMEIIYDFYKGYGYSEENIDIILGNYIQEFCVLEDWIETELQNLGYPYLGASLFYLYEIKKCYAPQNILFIEFL